MGAVSTLPLRALGVDLDVTCTGARAGEAYEALRTRWRLCDRDPASSAATELSVDLAPGADLAGFLVEVTHEITHRVITANVGRMLMFHAAGIANPTTGASVVFVAPGGTGKTTICRELAPGRGYLTDETVAIDADGVITPYPKPLSVRRASGGAKDEIAPDSIGLRPAAVTPYVEAVLVLERDDDGPQIPVIEQVDPFHSVTMLAPETSSLEQLPKPLHLLVDMLSRLSLLARVRYCEALSLEPLVTRLIGPPAP